MLPRRRDPIAIGAVMILLAAAGTARADGPTDEARAQADAQFAEGKQLLDAGQVAAACARFAKSQDLDPKLGRLLNLAFCHEQEGKTASAWNEYNAAAALAAQKEQPDRVDFAREHATLVARRLSFVRLGVPAGADAIAVDGAGVPRDRWTMPVPLDPGAHHVVVTGRGKKAASLAVKVATDPGVQEVAVPPLENEDAQSPASDTSTLPAPEEPVDASGAVETHRSRLPAYVVGGVAVVALGVGIAGGVQAMSKKGAANTECPAKQCDAAGRALVSDAQTAATISTVGFGVGIAGAAAAVWLFLRASPAASKAARLEPVVGPGSASLAFTGVW